MLSESEIGTKPQVLMVDDDRDFQSILRGWLSPRYDTVSLTDGEELFHELAWLDPDLVILDVNLPGPDGFRLCGKLRAVERLVSVPVLFLTGMDANADFLKYLEVGGTAYLTKPVERVDLLRAVDGLVAKA
jgi:DNA-binding response OmpR family regulator